MFAASLARQDFVGIVGGEFSPSLSKMREGSDIGQYLVRGKDVLVVWNDKPSSSNPLPNYVVVPDSEVRDFLAFATTYLSNLRPFSAFVRVLPLTLARSLWATRYDVVAEQPPRELVGMAMAEAFLQMGSKAPSLSEVPTQACLATLSAAVLSGLNLGYESDVIENIVESWLRARKVASDEPLRLSERVLTEFWLTLSPWLQSRHQSSYAPHGVEFVQSFLKMREFDDRHWAMLMQDVPELYQILETMRGTREERVRELERGLRVLSTSPTFDRTTKEMLAGALMSMVGQGSFDYMLLSALVSETLPAASMWFAFFSSLSRSSDVMTSGNCLGRRLVARLFPSQTEALSLQDVDIGLSELEVLFGDHGGFSRFRTISQTSIVVELVPGVSTWIRSPWIKRQGEQEGVRTEFLDEARYLADRLAAVIRRLERPSQGDLLENGGRKKDTPRGTSRYSKTRT